MNCNQYIDSTKAKNKRLFAAEKIQLRPAELENLLRHAFDAGRSSAPQEERCLFELVFGKPKA